MFTISLCMIVKDESDVLERILSQAKNFADEIVIVDTGSTDNTKQIAQKFTNKIYDFEWIDDFSEARNFAFSKGTCDYLMWLDADDYITQENIKKIQTLKKQIPSVDVFMCKYCIGIDENEKPQLVYFRERIVKRNSNFKWQGFVHEVISPSGIIKETDIEIQHRKLKITEPARNLKLYEKAIKKGLQLNPRELYYYSRELFYNNKIDKAIKNLKKYLKEKNTFPPDNLGAYLMLSDCYLIKSQPIEALNTLIDALKKHQPTAELCCKIGYVCEKINIETASFWFKVALLTKPQKNGFVREEYQELIPYIELSRLLYSSNYKLAKEYHIKAKNLQPTNDAVLYNDKFFVN